MKILFGMTLDSTSYPPLIVGRQAILGEMRCGPQGVIQVLETRLGLSGIWEPEPYRVEIYRQRLLAQSQLKPISSIFLNNVPPLWLMK